jgi:hypothetical protein
VIDSWTWSPTTASAAASAALLTPTHRPPPATSIVLPVNGVPLRLPVTRICRRPPRSATSAAGMSTTASPPGLSSRHWRTRALKATMRTSITCAATLSRHPKGILSATKRRNDASDCGNASWNMPASCSTSDGRGPRPDQASHRDTHARLAQVKRGYDPHNLSTSIEHQVCESGGVILGEVGDGVTSRCRPPASHTPTTSTPVGR